MAKLYAGGGKMATNELGQFGERFVINFLHDQGKEVYQVDAFWKDYKDDKVYFAEIKTKSKKYNDVYTGFSGYGMKKRQVHSRLKLQNEWLNSRCVLFVLDKEENTLNWQFLDSLYSRDDYTGNRTSNYLFLNNDIIFDYNSFNHIQLTAEEVERFSKDWD